MSDENKKEDKSVWQNPVVIAPVVAGIFGVIIAIATYITQTRVALLPIEATQTAEARLTQIARPLSTLTISLRDARVTNNHHAKTD